MEESIGQSIIYNKNASTRLDELIVCLSGCQNVRTRAFHIVFHAFTKRSAVCTRVQTAFQRHLIPSSVLPMTIVGHFSHRLLNLSNHNTTELSSFLFRIKCIWRRKGYHTSSCTVYSWKSFTAGVLIAVIKVSHCIFFVFLIMLTALVVTHILSEMLYLTDHRQSVELVDSYCTNCCLTVS